MNEDIYKSMKNLGEDNWWFLVQKKIVALFLERHLKSRSNLEILDAGCGTGRLFKTLSHYGAVWGIETHKDSAVLCRETGYKDVWNGTIENSPYEDEIFDVITCVDVLEHVEKDGEGLCECFRMLKKGGFIFITVPVGQCFFSKNERQYGHYRRYNIHLLKEKMGQAGFKIRETAYFNLLLLVPIVMARKIIDMLLTLKIIKKPVGEIELPPFIDRILRFIFSLEWRALKRFRLPYGLSLLVVAEKE